LTRLAPFGSDRMKGIAQNGVVEAQFAPAAPEVTLRRKFYG
jgi:hypothetical protein